MVEEGQTYKVTALGTIETAHGDIEGAGFLSPCRVTPGDDLLPGVSEDGNLVVGYVGKICGESQGILKQLFRDAGIKTAYVPFDEKQSLFVGDVIEPFHDLRGRLPLLHLNGGFDSHVDLV